MLLVFAGDNDRYSTETRLLLVFGRRNVVRPRFRVSPGFSTCIPSPGKPLGRAKRGPSSFRLGRNAVVAAVLPPHVHTRSLMEKFSRAISPPSLPSHPYPLSRPLRPRSCGIASPIDNGPTGPRARRRKRSGERERAGHVCGRQERTARRETLMGMSSSELCA